MTTPKNGSFKTPPKRSIKSFLLTFIIMAVTWIVLSGQFDGFHIALGVISCALVAWFSGDFLFPPRQKTGITSTWIKFIPYMFWLLWEIVKANCWLTYLIFHPKMLDKIDPTLVRFDTTLESQMARLTLANSITLTPGTITVSANTRGLFVVHSIDSKSAKGVPGDMEKNIAKTFGEL